MNQQDDNKKRSGLINAPYGNANSNASLNALAALMARPRAENLYYNSKRLVLDGYTWVGCRFDNCILEVKSNNFEIVECIIDPTTAIEYNNGTKKLIELFLARYEWAYEHFPTFVPKRHANGTISITASLS
jgi:hypothetical protein